MPKDEPDAEPLVTCAIITTEPNPTMAEIHDRMPVIVKPDDFAQWLDPRTSVDQAKRMVKPYDGPMRKWKVSTRVNKAGEQSAELLAPID
jgi:putative SOS response-associated peptidase YedK